jgi:hypothetical protein
MGTKNEERGYGYVGFYFRRFMVKELRNSELKRARYKFSKFIGKTRMKRSMEIIYTILAKGNEWKIFR